MAGLIPDAIGDTLGQIANLYKQVEEAKLTVQLAKAQASLAQAGAASAYQNAQAKADEATSHPGDKQSNSGLWIAGAVAVAALIYIVK